MVFCKCSIKDPVIIDGKCHICKRDPKPKVIKDIQFFSVGLVKDPLPGFEIKKVQPA